MRTEEINNAIKTPSQAGIGGLKVTNESDFLEV
jgi:hypothetical protein